MHKCRKRLSINEMVAVSLESSLGPNNDFDNADYDRQLQQDLDIVGRKGEANRKDPKTYKKLDDEKDNDDKIDYTKVKPAKAKDMADFLKTQLSLESEVGRHNHVPKTAFIPTQLKIGQKIEHEHTDDNRKALNIAKDHLAEIPDYYTRLTKMEKDAEKDKKPYTGR